MRKVVSALEPLIEDFEFHEKNFLEIGCGKGDITRLLAERGARVIGLDLLRMLAGSDRSAPLLGTAFIAGLGQSLPVKSGWADAVLFIASLHHVPPQEMPEAIREAHRVLKPGGEVLFIEPLVDCTYYRITGLAEEETEVRRKAQEAILSSSEAGFFPVKEDYFYVERTFDDFTNLLDVFFEGNPDERADIEDKAWTITRELAADEGCEPDAYIFQSACRLDLLKKTG